MRVTDAMHYYVKVCSMYQSLTGKATFSLDMDSVSALPAFCSFNLVKQGSWDKFSKIPNIMNQLQTDIVQPNSLAAVSRNSADIPFASWL